MSDEASVRQRHEREQELTRIDALQDRPNWQRAAALEAEQLSEETPASICRLCGGARWIKAAVPFNHPRFGCSRHAPV